MINTRVFVCCLAVLHFVDKASGLSSCITCASAPLDPIRTPSLWQLTGLPKPIVRSNGVNGNFYDSAFCQDPSAQSAQEAKFHEACTSSCMTIAVNDPSRDVAGVPDLNPANLLYVRGCWDKLTEQTWMANDINKQTFMNGHCEMGTYKTFSDEGDRTAFGFNQFCSSDHCNNMAVKNSTNLMTCTSKLTSQAVRPCYQCHDDDWNCKQGQCNLDASATNGGTGNKYCKKTKTKINDEYNTIKTCSPINPFMSDNGCSRYRTNSTFITRSMIWIEADTCFCNDQDYCNASSQTVGGMLGVVLSVIVAYFV